LQSKIEIQAAQGGLTLADIEEKFGVGRRTAMRMRDAGKHTFPQIEEVVTSERTERWRIPTGTLGRLAAYSVEELTALQSAVRLMGRDNWQVEAAELAEPRPLIELGVVEEPRLALLSCREVRIR
jgi:hypothetical protein